MKRLSLTRANPASINRVRKPKKVCLSRYFFGMKPEIPGNMPRRRTTKAKKKKRKIAPVSHPIWRKARRLAVKAKIHEGQQLIDGTLLGTGFVQEVDPRDGDFPLGTVTGDIDDPRSKEKVWQLPDHLLNQGSTNSCVGHACAHFILAAPRMIQTVDAIALWHRAQEIDEFPNNEGTNQGTSVRAGFKVLREQNLIASDYRWANNADEALRFILTRGPVVVGSKWYPGMGAPTNGVMRLTGSAGSIGHAYVLFGFSPDQDAFLMANSWGSTWGIDGCAFLPYDALDQLIEQDGVVCSAVEE
jgi:Papain family cysteine protease